MIDRPEPVALLTAMAATLTDQVVPDCSGGPQHAARVVANLCRILAREFDLGTENHDVSLHDLQRLLGSDEADLAALVAELDAQLRSDGGTGADHGGAVDDRDLFEALSANVDRRLAIAKPEYR